MAQPSLERVVSADAERWMSPGVREVRVNRQRAHLLPGFDEFLLGYKDRSDALPARYAGRVVPGGNGVFIPTLVLDGQVAGTWRRSTRATSVAVSASPFTRLTASDRKEFGVPLARYAEFLGAPTTISW
jgi:hypothetical protein